MSPSQPEKPAVELRIPASSGYLVLARVTVASICSRLDFPLDRLDDVKLAVDEACSLLIADALPGSVLAIDLYPEPPDSLQLTISGQTLHGRTPKPNSFAWTVLNSLVDSVTAVSNPSHLVTFTMRTQAGIPTAGRPRSGESVVSHER